MYESRRKLPCPCGRKLLQVLVTHEHYDLEYYIKCPKCGRRTVAFTYEIEAIRDWNRRVKERDFDVEADNP